MDKNYVPLYRKYRPQTLEMLVGQEHVKKTLTSAIELGKIAHAFLFTGPRGTGKTSTARILAKSLNCKNGPTIHPCGECESCREIINGVPIDVIEIDAASNRKVEDTQNILEKIQYVPVNGKYKIYIIDEVHMLTNHAFNALLKTLEEPPENVIFILATTEVHKVLDTIKSRCQRFDFRRITTDDIVKHLRYISNKENINISDDALFSIAKNSAGGMRDSISLLDQLSLLGASKQITTDDVNAILGRISFDVLNKLSEKIISSSPNEAIEILNEIYNSGNEPLQILINLLEYFKNLLIVKNCSGDLLNELTGLNEPQINMLMAQKDKLEVQQTVFLIERLSYYIKEVKMASNQHLWLEVSMIDLANMTENSSLIDLQNRIKAIEEGSTVNIQKNISIPPVITRPAPIPPHTELKENKTKEAVTEQHNGDNNENDFTPPPMSKKLDENDISVLWNTLLSNIKSPATKALLNLASPVKICADEVIITFKNEKLVAQMNANNKKDLLVDSADLMFGQKDTKVIIRLPMPDDEKFNISLNEPANKSVDSFDSARQVKKNDILEKSAQKSKTPVLNNDLETDAEENTSDTIETPDDNKSVQTDKNHLDNDQEKMILDLFDGKFID